jgi:hypothetical protein
MIIITTQTFVKTRFKRIIIIFFLKKKKKERKNSTSALHSQLYIALEMIPAVPTALKRSIMAFVRGNLTIIFLSLKILIRNLKENFENI